MNAWMHVAGWVLVHFVWQGAVVAVVAVVVLHLCRRKAASVRYLIACGAMIAMLAGVMATAALMEAPATAREAARVSVDTRLQGSADVLLPIAINEGLTSPAASTVARVEALLPWIVSAWLFG